MEVSGLGLIMTLTGLTYRNDMTSFFGNLARLFLGLRMTRK
jgi:hypothetical protein